LCRTRAALLRGSSKRCLRRWNGRLGDALIVTHPGCRENCYHSSDDDCDDGGYGSESALCDSCSDCTDCGQRTVAECTDACACTTAVCARGIVEWGS